MNKTINNSLCIQQIVALMILSIPIILWPTTVSAQSFKLDLLFDGLWSECSQDNSASFKTIAGSEAGLCVTILPIDGWQSDFTFRGITDWTWPPELRIEISTVGVDSVFQPSSELSSVLQIQYYLPWYQLQNDSIWRATGWVPNSDWRFPEYNFVFRLPSDLAGQRLRFHVRYSNTEFGVLDTVRDLEIFAPCSDVDSEKLFTSYIYMANKAHDYESVISYADSFVVLGWRSQIGLTDAANVARLLQHYDTALRYLDLCYEANGSVNTPGMYNPSDTAASRIYYERKRSQLVEMKNQQDQR